MKISLFVVCATAFLTSGAVVADEDAVVADEDTNESTPIELSAAQMDQITAGTLQLNNNNNKEIFAGFDNPSPDVLAAFCDPAVSSEFCHPALTRRSDTARAATTGNGPSVDGFGNDGPWAATVVSPVITCVGFSLPPDFMGMGGGGCSP